MGLRFLWSRERTNKGSEEVKRLFLIAALALSACTNEEETRRTLNAAGYTDIQIGGYAAFACGQDDTYSTRFSAANPRGVIVEGVVCCGLLKGCTVRF